LTWLQRQHIALKKKYIERMASSVFALCTCGGGDDVVGIDRSHGDSNNKRPVSAMIKNAAHTGYLMKQSAWLKNWRRRFFFLSDNVLYFAVDKGFEPHGQIPLTYNNIRVQSAEEFTNKRFSFMVQIPGMTFFLQARNEREKDQWIRAIGQAITMRQIHESEEVFDD
jgi:hypothetical protein